MHKEDTKKIVEYLNEIDERLELIYELINKPEIKPPGVKQKDKKPTPKITVAQASAIADLGPTPDILTELWPEAVPAYLIINDADDIIKRHYKAVQIIRSIDGDIRHNWYNSKVLEIGCGEGFLSYEIANYAGSVVAYDINEDTHWKVLNDKNNLTFTNNDKDLAGSNFDYIVLYDVLDHIEKLEYTEFMLWVKSLLKPNGKMIIRTHPWTSKHGGHLYQQHNKAYLHLALSIDELDARGLKLIPNLKIAKPLASYDSIFKSAGLKILNTKTITETVDKYIIGRLIDRINKNTWSGEINTQLALKIMSIQYLDYLLCVD